MECVIDPEPVKSMPANTSFEHTCWCLQDDIFKQYANECINEYASRGNTTVPLQRMLNKKEGLQPFMP
eukprot:scaffold257843_cov17-Tisochrysis_lutea.AAC.1